MHLGRPGRLPLREDQAARVAREVREVVREGPSGQEVVVEEQEARIGRVEQGAEEEVQRVQNGRVVVVGVAAVQTGR